MPDTPFTVDRFTGLDALTAPEHVGATGATGGLNYELDRPGAVRCRDGYANLTSVAGADVYRALHFSGSDGMVLGVRNGAATTIEAINAGGFVTASRAAALNGIPSLTTFASVGSLGATTTFIACSALGTNVQVWNGVTLNFSNAVFTGSGTPPATTDLLASWGERLVAAEIDPPGKLKFSDAGAPTVFSTNNFVIPDAGDGENAVVLTPVGNYMVLVRRTKLFVFTGVSTESDGSPVFNYFRVVFGDIGVILASALAPDGLFLLTELGLFKWVAGATGLALISEMPRRMFGFLFEKQPPQPPSAAGYGRYPATVFGQRVLFGCSSLGSSTLDRTIVFDQSTGNWMVWDIAAQSLLTASYSTGSKLLFGLPSKHIAAWSAAATTDAGSPISWSYKSGRYPLANPGAIAITRESALWGVGTVTLALDTDLYATQSGVVTLGASDTAEGWLQKDQEGHWFQHTLSGTGPASVSRITHYVSSVRGTDQEN